MGGLGDSLIRRIAEAAAGVVEGPQQRLEHGHSLGGDRAVGLALLCPAGQAARPVHDPDLGVAVARGGRGERVLAREPAPPRSSPIGRQGVKTVREAGEGRDRRRRFRLLGGKLFFQGLNVALQGLDMAFKGVHKLVRLFGYLYEGLSVVSARSGPSAADCLLARGLRRNAEFIGGLFIGEPRGFHQRTRYGQRTRDHAPAWLTRA